MCVRKSSKTHVMLHIPRSIPEDVNKSFCTNAFSFDIS